VVHQRQLLIVRFMHQGSEYTDIITIFPCTPWERCHFACASSSFALLNPVRHVLSFENTIVD
jgi:hypothetical protein